MANNDNLRRFGAYVKALELFDHVVADLTQLMNNPALHRLVSQQFASADSVASNIEEGFGRGSRKECVQRNVFVTFSFTFTLTPLTPTFTFTSGLRTPTDWLPTTAASLRCPVRSSAWLASRSPGSPQYLGRRKDCRQSSPGPRPCSEAQD